MKNLSGKILLGLQLVIAIASVLAGYLLWREPSNYVHFLGTILLYSIYTCLGGTILLHRIMSHCHSVSPVVKKLLSLLTVPMVSGSPLGWALVHRTHHRYQDTEKDPHSPLFKSRLWIHFLAITYVPTNTRLVIDLLGDRFQIKLHKAYVSLCTLWVFGLLLILPLDIYCYYVALPSFLTWHAGSSINSFGHSRKRLSPINRPFLSFFTFGEGSHANHHDYPRSLRFNSKSILDLGGVLLERLKKYA